MTESNSISPDALILLLTLAAHEGRESEILADVGAWRELVKRGLASLGRITPEGKAAAARLLARADGVLG